MEKKRPFSKLSTAANSLNQQVDFVQAYAKDKHGHPYREVHADNFMQILSGASRWDQINQDQKLIINGILLAGEGISYDELMRTAKKLKRKTDDFLQTYLTGIGNTNGFEVDGEHYEQILLGKREWSIMSDDLKKITNAVLHTYVGHGFEELLNEAETLKDSVELFLQSYACDDHGVLYDAVDTHNYKKILSGQKEWRNLSQKEKESINQVWEGLGFDQLLNMALMLDSSSKSFVKVYISDKNGTPYHNVTIHNYEQLLSGWSFWKKQSKDQRKLIDELLIAQDIKIYEDLVMDAREFDDRIKEFISCYVCDEQGNMYTEINAENYAQVLAGEADWEVMNPEEQAAVNKHLGYQCISFDNLLNQARAFQKNVMDFIHSYADKQQAMDLHKEGSEEGENLQKQGNIGQAELKSMEKELQRQLQQAKVMHKTTVTHGNVKQDQITPVKPVKGDNKAYKGPVAVCGMLSIAALALLGKKKKK